MQLYKITILLILFSITSNQYVSGGPILGAACQAGCAAVVVACYAAAGAVFGTVAAAGAPPAILACNAAFAKCMVACAAVYAAPTP
jgi:hypothetical protein